MTGSQREAWATRVGLILAMAGNAVGLGNFLRFPVQAAQHGGGTFMIPYFLSFVLLGIPLMWIEWGIGRYGGARGRGSLPGMMDAIWNRPIAKYLGVLGLAIPLITFIYYSYIESWTLAYVWFSATGGYADLRDPALMTQFLRDFHVSSVAPIFFVITLLINVWVLSRGISGGIEKVAKIGLPLLFLFALVLVIRVLTLPPTAAGSAIAGLDYVWNPEFGQLGQPSVWLAAAGQVFFTLSLGVGSLHCYASYLRKNDDIALTGLTTAATNETAEVVLGGSLVIPATVAFFGISGAVMIANQGAYDLPFVGMSLVFLQLPGPPIIGMIAGVMWFGLLFIAGITSSLALASPSMAFMQEHFEWSRRKTALGVGVVAVVLGALHVLYYPQGYLAEWDYWAGSFGLVVVATIEVIVFVWIFGVDRAWAEIHQGAQIRILPVFRFVMKWVTPAFLLLILGWWTVQQAVPTLLLEGVAEEQHAIRWVSRAVMLGMLIVLLFMVRHAWRVGHVEGARTEEGASQ